MGRLLRISDAANFAIHAMVLIAQANGRRRMSVLELAGILDVSEAHLGKVLQRLTRQGFLLSRRGPGGGFELAREPHDVTLLDVVSAIDGPLTAGPCLLGRPLCVGKRCAMLGVLEKVHKLVFDHLEGTRLSDVVEQDLHHLAAAVHKDVA
ncbi:MAG TPA: Rrf2 family transcriptional regulator [Myxococcota bacterium]|nr:Rrf2 family transcriptional regulator [Myxococcota bacterium]